MVVTVLTLIVVGAGTGTFVYRRFARGDLQGSVKGKPRGVVIFDFDGTLCDSFSCLLHSLQKNAARYGIKGNVTMTPEEVRDYHAKDLFKKLKIPFYKLPLVLRDFRLQWDQERHCIKQKVQIKPLLEYLKKNNYAVGVVTSNSVANVHYFLGKENLASYFDFVGSSPSIFGKKHALKKALKLMKKRPEYIVYVGDETRDIDAARGIGAECVSVTWGMNSEKALLDAGSDVVCSSPEEIIHYLMRTHDSSE